MRVLISRMRTVGRATRDPCTCRLPADHRALLLRHRHVHSIRVVCPRFMNEDRPREQIFAEMANELGADSLRYLPIESIARALHRPAEELCRACITGRLPDATRPETLSSRASQRRSRPARRWRASSPAVRTSARRAHIKSAALLSLSIWRNKWVAGVDRREPPACWGVASLHPSHPSYLQSARRTHIKSRAVLRIPHALKLRFEEGWQE